MKKALIVGASSNLAEDLIPCLLADGFRLALHYGRHKEKLVKYKEQKDVFFIPQVLEGEKDCKSLAEQYLAWENKLDALLILLGDVFETVEWPLAHEDGLMANYRINAVLPVLLASFLYSHMDQGGKIVFVSTASAAHGGGRNSLGYGMAKAALECATKRIAKDLAKNGISVNAIAPGYMDTELQIRAKGIPANENWERLKTIPMGRAGKKSEFAALARYLVSDDASFLTGQVITLDGGDFV